MVAALRQLTAAALYRVRPRNLALTRQEGEHYVRLGRAMRAHTDSTAGSISGSGLGNPVDANRPLGVARASGPVRRLAAGTPPSKFLFCAKPIFPSPTSRGRPFRQDGRPQEHRQLTRRENYLNPTRVMWATRHRMVRLWSLLLRPLLNPTDKAAQTPADRERVTEVIDALFASCRGARWTPPDPRRQPSVVVSPFAKGTRDGIQIACPSSRAVSRHGEPSRPLANGAPRRRGHDPE